MITVCLIDDDDLLRFAIAAELRYRGYVVAEAGEADVGLRLAMAIKPAVAVIDILMPNKDGLELMAEFAKKLPAVKIVAISTGGRGGDDLYLDAAKSLGAHACIRKPIDFAHLSQTIEALAHPDERIAASGA